MCLKDSFAVVTGASSGIGYAFAVELASRGYNIVAVSNAERELLEKSGAIGAKFNVEVIPVTMDLSEQCAARKLFDFCSQKNLDVEFLVNNAGVYHDRDFLDDTEEFNSLILMLHTFTPAMLEYYFGKKMLVRGRGYIINMSSVTSRFGIQRMSTYSSTKGFLELFSRSTHIELKGKGVNVTCVRPGAIATTLYNLKPSAIRIGLALGYISTPEALATKAVRAVLNGKSQITPGLSTKILQFLVSLLPIGLLRLVRRMKIF